MTRTANDLVAEAKTSIAEISVKALTGLDKSALVLIDVREPEEYAAGHLPGAINIPRGVLEFRIESHPALNAGRQCPIAVYCQTGGRSALAALSLKRMGFEHIQSLAGGFLAWQEAGYATVSN
ncbi:MAG: sulfurtransferase [Xanthomonadaceae bacterium]|jgi:rhodanese-related sulfurtransferase|nr:sulfurtransferase [Xanthomonadaceae bacterium]